MTFDTKTKNSNHNTKYSVFLFKKYLVHTICQGVYYREKSGKFFMHFHYITRFYQYFGKHLKVKCLRLRRYLPFFHHNGNPSFITILIQRIMLSFMWLYQTLLIICRYNVSDRIPFWLLAVLFVKKNWDCLPSVKFRSLQPTDCYEPLSRGGDIAADSRNDVVTTAV